MCGIVGFFVGCESAITCPKRKICAATRQYRSSFDKWDTRASVRNAPRRLDQMDAAMFPERFVPVLKHPQTKELPESARTLLRRAALFRFMNFTHKLEMLVVNTVTANIALGRYDADFSDPIRLDAHRIYVDEAYHALFSFEYMQNMPKQEHERAAFAETMPAFVTRANAITAACDPADRALIELLAVIISEMLITTTLRDSAREQGMDPAAAVLIQDHARDEARHHAFYKNVLLHLWPRLCDRRRSLVIDSVYPLLTAYTAPDIEAMLAELLAAGVPENKAQSVLAETYDENSVSEYARTCGAGIVQIFEELASVTDQRRLAESFHQSVLIKGAF